MKTTKLITLIQISIFAAISTIVMFFEVPVFFLPNFYKLDFSDAIVLISGFSLGPLAGVMTQGVKILLSLLIKGSSSLGIGQFANFITGIFLILPSSLIYKKYRTFKGACLSMLAGVSSLVFISACLNYFMLIPIYEKLFLFEETTIISLANAINPFITDRLTFVLFGVCPFNLLKGILVCTLALLLYKKLTSLINKISSANKK